MTYERNSYSYEKKLNKKVKECLMRYEIQLFWWL
jgi:hypothetical protein